MKPLLRINVDDLGISPGCNAAAAEAARCGGVHSASILATGDYMEDAFLRVVGPFPNLEYGVHLNLTYGRSLSASPQLTRNGLFRYGFLGLLLQTAWRPALRREVEIEWDTQIRALMFRGVRISHLDSHRHVHMIPWLYRIAVRLADKYGIPEVRHARERIRFSLRIARSAEVFTNGGLVKLLILRALGLFCPRRTERSLFSVLYTGRIRAEMLDRLAAASSPVEALVHPGFPGLDQPVQFYDTNEQAYRLSPHRRAELEACLETALQRAPESPPATATGRPAESDS